MKKLIWIAIFIAVIFYFGFALGNDTVPPEINLPGTQPLEVTLETPSRCLNCHEG